MERRLAAILAADVVGYTRMMGADEAGTLSALRMMRSELFDPTVEKHRGRIVKLMGDGVLVDFASVVDAVNCAAEVQEELATRNADRSEDQRLVLRIGINLGDVIVDGGDLYGDGVNIATRLETEAEPGGISVGQSVVDQARGKVAVGFEYLGERRLKNVEAPVQLYNVVADPATGRASVSRPRRPVLAAIGGMIAVCIIAAGGWYFTQSSRAAAIDIGQVLTIKGPAIAALPFSNLSGDAEHDLFAIGLTEQIAAALTRFNGVRVLSRRASAKYVDDLDALRRELGADYLLEGSIRRTPESLQITSVLIKLETGDQIWTDTFEVDATPANIVDAQDQLAGRIAGVIADERRGVIAIDRVADRGSAPPNDQSTLDCFVLSGASRSTERVRSSFECLTTALEKDPGYAAGWSRLVELLGDAYAVGTPLSNEPGYDPLSMMMDAGHKAVELAPNSALAHYALAQAYYYNGDQEGFVSEVVKFLALNPNDAGLIGWLGTQLAFSGRWDEGAALVEKAQAFNDSVVSPSAGYALAKGHYFRGEYPEALEDFKPLWTAYRGFWVNNLNRAYLYADWGKQQEAEAAAAALMAQIPDFVIEDAVEFYRRLRFEEPYIDKMVAALTKAGLPSRAE